MQRTSIQHYTKIRYTIWGRRARGGPPAAGPLSRPAPRQRGERASVPRGRVYRGGGAPPEMIAHASPALRACTHQLALAPPAPQEQPHPYEHSIKHTYRAERARRHHGIDPQTRPAPLPLITSRASQDHFFDFSLLVLFGRPQAESGDGEALLVGVLVRRMAAVAHEALRRGGVQL